MKQLATDLGLWSWLLYEIVKFRRVTPKVPSKALLSWSHYRTVLPMPDIVAQNRLLAEAERQRWTVAELTQQITSSVAKAMEDGGEQGGGLLRQPPSPRLRRVRRLRVPGAWGESRNQKSGFSRE